MVYLKLKKNLSCKVFHVLFFMNVLFNVVLLCDNNDFTFISFLVLISSSAFFAFLESCVYLLIPWRILRRIYLFFLLLIHFVVGIVDYFLLIKFDQIISEGIMDTIMVTNRSEISNFINSYLSPWILFLFLSTLIVLFWAIFTISKRIGSKIIYVNVFFVLVFPLLPIINNYTKSSLTDYNVIIRSVKSYWLAKNREKIGDLRHACLNEKAIKTKVDSLIIVVVIGESHSIFHSSLYNYPKQTNPLLAKRLKEKELFVFNNVVSLSDVTYSAMKSIFSFDSYGSNFSNIPLFPASFKSAGFRTILLDNNYILGQEDFFLTNKLLSKTLFDYRNPNGYQYDEDIIDEIEYNYEVPSLYIYHLMGQHTSYENRYPKRFGFFFADDYEGDNLTEKQRKVVANYDNATLYNDYVIDKIIKKFENSKCVLFYFSDHGEELFELNDFFGHGTSRKAKIKDYQLRVPFFIWMSDTYRLENPQVMMSLLRAIDYPIITDDISHTILGVAGIKSQFYNSARDFLSNDYSLEDKKNELNNILSDK